MLSNIKDKTTFANNLIKALKDARQARGGMPQYLERELKIFPKLLKFFQGIQTRQRLTLEIVTYYLLHFINHNEAPVCKGCGREVLITIVRLKNKSTDFCSQSCYRKSDLWQIAAKKKLFEKYGVINISQIPSVKEKKILTVLKNYGQTNPSKVKEIQDKKVITSLERFGSTNFLSSTYGKRAVKEGIFRKYGVPHNSNIPEVKISKIESSRRKFGTNHPWQAEVIKEKVRSTCMTKYGAASIMQVPEILSRNTRSRYKNKNVIIAGREVQVKGYEPYCIDWIKEFLKEEDIKAGFKEVPSFSYEEKGVSRKYFPDIYLPKLDAIIEVKSKYTITMQPNKLPLKKEAVIKAGYKFFLVVFSNKGLPLEIEDLHPLKDLLQRHKQV